MLFDFALGAFGIIWTAFCFVVLYGMHSLAKFVVGLQARIDELEKRLSQSEGSDNQIEGE